MADLSLRAKSAQSNVVRLPTAARRKVKQVWTPENRQARMALHRIPKERFLYPPVREAIPVAKELLTLRDNITVELELLTALLETLDGATRQKMKERLFQGVLDGRRTAYQAMALIQGTKLTYGQQKDLDAAFAFIAREGAGQ